MIDAQGVPGRFKQARTDLEIKAKDLARDAGLSASQVSHFESGRKGLDTSRLLALFAAASRRGISIDYVVRGPRSQSSSEFIVTPRAELRALLAEVAEANPATESLGAAGVGRHESHAEKLEKRPNGRAKRRARE